MTENYWIDTGYVYGDYSVPKIAIMKSIYDEEGEIVSVTVIDWIAYKDLGIATDADSADFIDDNWEKVDAWITSTLGFLPQYEVN